MSPDRIFIFSSPRTASNLFVRILSLPDQPKVFPGEYAEEDLHFLPAHVHMRKTRLLNKPYSEWTEMEKNTLKVIFQDGSDKLLGVLESARAAGKVAVVKEHLPFLSEPLAREKLVNKGTTAGPGEIPWKVQLPEEYDSLPLNLVPNETVFPNEFLLTCLPTFLIRHPMLAFPSYYRKFKCVKEKDTKEIQELHKIFGCVMTFKWTRSIYDWYMNAWEKYGTALNRPKPIILEADDILETKVLVRYCQLVGLDPSKLKYTWDPVSAAEKALKDPSKVRMKDTLYASTGILENKTAKNLILEDEASKWKAEFGESEGSQLEAWVKAAMPDYEYLWNNRLTV